MRVYDVMFLENGYNKQYNTLCTHNVRYTHIRQKRSASRRPQVNEHGGYASRAVTNDSIDGESKDVYLDTEKVT